MSAFVIAVPAKGRLMENAEDFFARAGLALTKPRGAREYRGAIGRVTVAPTAVGLSASGVTSAAATLTGSLKPNSQATDAYIEWGTTTAYGQSTAPQAIST